MWDQQFSFGLVEGGQSRSFSKFVTVPGVRSQQYFLRIVQIAVVQLLFASNAYPSIDPILGLHILEEVLLLWTMIEGPNASDQTASVYIPFILSGSPIKTCHACVIPNVTECRRQRSKVKTLSFLGLFLIYRKLKSLIIHIPSWGDRGTVGTEEYRGITEEQGQ